MRRGSAWRWAAIAGVVAVGVAGASRLAWVCDDAFISYRYARNLANGLGLVYNAGERVEGYSNFLWTLLLAGAAWLNADPVWISQALGIAAFAATLGLLAWTSGRLTRARAIARVPLAAALLALHYHALEFATGGLETALFAWLVTAVTVSAIAAKTPLAHARTTALAVLAALCRPDGALLLAVAAVPPLLDAIAKRSVRGLVYAALPVVFVYLPYLGWKLAYYGDLLPNTFYAKAAGVATYSRGLAYLASYFAKYPWLALGIAGPAAVLAFARGSARAPAYLLAVCALYLWFVARVGGDFMFARFCIPVTALLCLGIELSVCRIHHARLRGAAAVVVVLAALVSFALAHQAPPGDPASGVVEERAFYPADTVRAAAALGAQIRTATAGIPVRVAIYGSQAMLAYYADLPWVLEAHAGLTDPEIARTPLHERGRAGHERSATLVDLRRREVDLVFDFGLFHPAAAPWKQVSIGDARAVFVTYRREIADALRARDGVAFVDFPAFLDDYLARADQLPDETVRRDLAEFSAFYLDHNRDPERDRAAAARSFGGAPAPAY